MKIFNLGLILIISLAYLIPTVAAQESASSASTSTSISEKLNELKLEIGETDILLIPVGGVYTIDAKAAAEVVSELEPKIIIPMHYKVEGLKFELDPVDNFLKEMGIENIIPVNKLTITKDKLPEEPQVVVLSKN